MVGTTSSNALPHFRSGPRSRSRTLAHFRECKACWIGAIRLARRQQLTGAQQQGPQQHRWSKSSRCRAQFVPGAGRHDRGGHKCAEAGDASLDHLGPGHRESFAPDRLPEGFSPQRLPGSSANADSTT